MTSRTWDFTFFPATPEKREEEIARWRRFDLRRVVIGLEKCPETGREHLQGKVTWNRAYRAKQLHKLLPGYHVESSLAPKDFNYCMKENVVLERNESKQGARTDIQQAMVLVRDKKPRLELMETYPSVVARYSTFLDSYSAELKLYSGPRIVIWAYGPTGSGKTRTFFDTIEDGVPVNISNGFFNGYKGENAVILDDFRHDKLPFAELLRILDRYPHTVNVKGSSLPWNARLIYITSPCHPKDCYPTLEDRAQLLRRINVVAQFPTDVDNVSEALQGYRDSQTRSAESGQGQPAGDVSGSSSSSEL